MGIEKQVEYWRSGSKEDWEVAEKLVRDGATRHGLFFAHLTLEKMLKGLVCRHTDQPAPRTHNLARLAQLAGLRLSESLQDTLADMNQFNIEGRYPETLPAPPNQMEAMVFMNRSQEALQWLKAQY